VHHSCPLCKLRTLPTELENVELSSAKNEKENEKELVRDESALAFASTEGGNDAEGADRQADRYRDRDRDRDRGGLDAADGMRIVGSWGTKVR
jgi:hypothetical protein